MLPKSSVVSALLLVIACDGPPPSPGDGGPDAGRPDASPAGDAGFYDGGQPQPSDGGPPACLPVVGPCGQGPCLRLNEALANNEGLWLDEALETEDYVELVNAGAEALDTADYFLGDRLDRPHRLPASPLQPGERLLVWLDGQQEQGSLHMPFKLSSKGEQLILWHLDGTVADCWSVPPLGANEVMARFPDGEGEPQVCAYGSPEAANPARCEPVVPPPEIPTYSYEAAPLPEPWPEPADGVLLNELALRQPAAFVELWAGARPNLDGMQLRFAAHGPGRPFPGPQDGLGLPLQGPLDGPAFHQVPVPQDRLQELRNSPDFEGVVTLFNGAGDVLDRVDFMHWPQNTSLARSGDGAGTWRLCQEPSPGEANQGCDVLPERAVGERVHRLLTPGDHAALAQGRRALGMEAVKVVIDRDAGGVVHLLKSEAWGLHYTFVRERIDGEPPLDRCIPEENRAFRQGWGDFSDAQYRQVEGRRYLLSTLVRYASNDSRTLEFTTGDHIVPEQIAEAFWGLMPSLFQPQAWALRPQGPLQHTKALELEGQLPIVAENAPFLDLVEQPLNPAIGYGVLRFIPLAQLEGALLGPQVILLTDQVPNELPLVGGLITEAFQTPLAHVNLLARNRQTPNLALRAARQDPRVAGLLDQLVRLEVDGAGFQIRAASAEEAEAFWAARSEGQEALVPRRYLNLRGIQDLADHPLDALPALGAKAAQLAQLQRTNIQRQTCPGPVLTPAAAFAIPLVHSVEHAQASGAEALLEELLDDPEFRTHPTIRAEGLAAVRQQILDHPVDASLLDELREAILQRYGFARVRLRSSSNTEDLPGFNGAGLYTSVSVAVGDADRPIADGLRQVWASLWTPRAYDERAWFHVDSSRLGMGVLVHAAFRGEQANGVGISRNVLDPDRGDIHFITAQAGEASVTNPAPGVVAESFLYRFGRYPPVIYQSRSSLTGGADVLSSPEIRQVACTLAGIHTDFRPLIDPEETDRYFAMDIEFKLIGEARQLLVKQARPFRFGRIEPVGDCREF